MNGRSPSKQILLKEKTGFFHGQFQSPNESMKNVIQIQTRFYLYIFSSLLRSTSTQIQNHFSFSLSKRCLCHKEQKMRVYGSQMVKQLLSSKALVRSEKSFMSRFSVAAKIKTQATQAKFPSCRNDFNLFPQPGPRRPRISLLFARLVSRTQHCKHIIKKKSFRLFYHSGEWTVL